MLSFAMFLHWNFSHLPIEQAMRQNLENQSAQAVFYDILVYHHMHMRRLAGWNIYLILH